MKRELSVTTDFYDNILWADRHFTKKDLDDLMAYCASLGATRHEWIVDTIWTLYDEDGPLDYDLLDEARQAAHRHGMRFDAVLKPFEGALDHPVHTFPSSFPRPEGTSYLEDIAGIVDPVRPFLIDHPDTRMARHPDDAIDPGGRIRTIRLIKNDDAPCPFGPEDLSIWTSSRNGGYVRHEGPVSLTETVEKRMFLPFRLADTRIVTLDGLDLPEDARYVLVRRENRGGDGDFTNDTDKIIELVNENGETIPSTPSRWRIDGELFHKRATQIQNLNLTRYGCHPEIKALVADKAGFLKATEGMFMFGYNGALGEVSLNRTDVDQDRKMKKQYWSELDEMTTEVVAARGKDRHVGGVPCPVYPEVREHWLEEVRFCLDRGVDGVGIRPGSHSQPFEPWAFGFNSPVMEKCQRSDDVAEAARVNGEGYDAFMRAASEMVRGAGKEFGVHVSADWLHHVDKAPDRSDMFRYVDRPWEKFVRDYADYVELRGITQMRRENLREIVARVALAAREAGIPLIHPGPLPTEDCVMEFYSDHPGVTCYMLYESAHFTKINDNDEFEGDTDVAERVRRFWG